MTIKEQINQDIKAAMKEKRAEELTALRGLIAVLNNKAIEKRAKEGQDGTLTEDESISALSTEAKKRKEAIRLYTEGHRPELAEQEAKELKIIERYLPQQMSADEIEKTVSTILEKTGIKEFGPAMKAVMEELKGKADAALVSAAVKKQLG